MAEPPPHGAIVSYLDPRATGADLLRRAVSIGPGIPDPQTHEVWLPVRRPDHVATLLDPALVVDVLPRPPATEAAAGDPVRVLRAALDAATRGLAEFDELSPRTWFAAQRLLNEFVDAIGPILGPLSDLAESEPAGNIATVLGYLVNAAAHLEEGDFAAWRAAMLTARTAMKCLAPTESDEWPEP